MPQGLQVWDENGVLVMDTTTLVMKQVSETVVTGNTLITVPAADAQTNIVPIAVPTVSDPNTKDNPEVYMDAGNIRVNYGANAGGANRVKVAYF